MRKRLRKLGASTDEVPGLSSNTSLKPGALGVHLRASLRRYEERRQWRQQGSKHDIRFLARRNKHHLSWACAKCCMMWPSWTHVSAAMKENAYFHCKGKRARQDILRSLAWKTLWNKASKARRSRVLNSLQLSKVEQRILQGNWLQVQKMIGKPKEQHHPYKKIADSQKGAAGHQEAAAAGGRRHRVTTGAELAVQRLQCFS